MSERVFVGLGANLGDRAAALTRAVEALGQTPGVRVVAQGPVLETPALLLPGQKAQPPFLNSVVELACALEPGALLAACLSVERALGRVRTTRWAARFIDLDVLFFGARVSDGPELLLPHPEAHRRRFVLEPLAAIAPEFVHPRLGKTVRELLATLTEA